MRCAKWDEPAELFLCYSLRASNENNCPSPELENAMKSILLPVDQSEQMPSALETAWLLASLFDGTVEGVALRPAFAEIVAPDPIVAVTIPPADWNETEFCRSVRQTFDAFAASSSRRAGRRCPVSLARRIGDRGRRARQPGARLRRDRAEPARQSRCAHDGGGSGAVRQRPARADGAADPAQVLRRERPHPLERQHRDGARDPDGDADPAQGQARDALSRRGRMSCRAPAPRTRWAISRPTASLRARRR